MITIEQLRQVFPAPEPPAEGDYELVANWLMNHGHKEPSQRVRAAIKSLTKTPNVHTLMNVYQDQMRTDLRNISSSDLAQLRKVKEYYIFPLYYLSLSEFGFIAFERTLNTLLRFQVSELNDLSPTDIDFLNSIEWDMTEISHLKYEEVLNQKIKSYERIWTRSVLAKLDQSDLAKKKLAKLRISEIYDIVKAYPDSIPALLDLKNSIDPSQRSFLISTFITHCSQDLLHAGTNTNEIILFFISTIKSFLIIDARSVLLDNASRPIRKYLKEREDTIVNIVHGLISYDDNPLHTLSVELSKKTSFSINNLTLDWFPDPIDALPDFRKQDIIESLISIFDTKELFISELVKAFSKKLLSLSQGYNIDDIHVKLQQLKWKFEENDLNSLDVMLKDIVDSERIDSLLHDEITDLSPAFHLSLLSYMYWPEFEPAEFRLPTTVEKQINLYFDAYKVNQKGRSLRWIDAGVVSINLQFVDRALSLEVSPSEAAVISCFDECSNPLSIDDITSQLDMASETAEKALNFWVQESVLNKLEGKYQIVEIPERKDDLVPGL